MNDILKTQIQNWSFADHILETPTGPGVNGFLPLLNVIKSDTKTKVLKENENSVSGRAQFLDEQKDPTAKDNSFAEVWLTPKRVITYVELSNELIENAGVNLEAHLNKRAQKRIQSVAERMITYTGYTGANGSVETSENMQLLTRGGNGFISTKTQSQNVLEFLLVKQVYSAYVNNGGNPKDAVWLFADSNTQVLDAQNNDVIDLNSDNLPNGAYGKLFNIPTVKASLPLSSSNHPIACALVSREAYSVLLGKTTFKKVDGDTAQAMRDSTLFLVRQDMDGKITNSYGKYAIEFADVIAQNQGDSEDVENPTMKMAAESENAVYVPLMRDTPYFKEVPAIGNVVFNIVERPVNMGKAEFVVLENDTYFDITANGVTIEAQSFAEIGKVADLKDGTFNLENAHGQAVEVQLNIIN